MFREDGHTDVVRRHRDFADCGNTNALWSGVSVGVNGGTGVLNLTGNSLFDATGNGGNQDITEIG